MPTANFDPLPSGLTPQQLYAYGVRDTGSGTYTWTNPADGKSYQLVPEYSNSRTGEGMDAGNSNDPTGWRLGRMIEGDAGGGWLGNSHLDVYNGMPYTSYGTDWTNKGDGKWTGVGGAPGPWAALATMFGGPLLGAGLGAAGLAGEAGAAGAGMSGAAFGDAGLMYAGADAAAAGSLLGDAAAGGLGGVTYGATGPSAFLQGAGITGGGTGAAGALTGGSALTNVLAGGAGAGLGGLLGPAATLLGGLAGAQGQDAEQTTKRDIPDWLKPYITGENGLLAQANSLLQKQMAPGYLAGYDQMRSAGQNLMNTPQVGNGFSRFFPGK